MLSSQHNQALCTRTRRQLAIGVLALIAALWALSAPAGAAGLRQGPTSPSALATATDQLTGSPDAGQLSTKSVCSAPAAGRASCLAALLISTATGQALALAPVSEIEPARTVAGAQNLAFTSPLAAPLSAPASAAEPAAGTPAYLQQAYDLSALSQTAGTGDTVAIVDAYDDPNAESDLAAYRANYGLPACSSANGCFAKVNESGAASYPAPDALWAVEISLDLDAVSALCPNCHITLVEANSNYLSDLNAAESEAVALGAQQVSNSWAGTSPAGLSGWSFPGTAILAAAGDSGWWGNGAAYYPASLPTVTSVGGTSLSPSAASASAPRGFSESAWGYQYDGTQYGTGSGCDNSEQKPAWQTDSGCAGRTSTDISADADPNTGLRVYDTYQTGGSGWFAVGGTSLASPLTAAYYALTQAQSADPAPPQWAYANAAELNDPASGENGACGNYLCQAGPGYDGPTGNGSISGDVVSGAPGIGGPGQYGTYSATTTSSGTQVSAGVYPNGLDTSVFIQYGSTNAYGQHSTAVDVGSSSSPQLAQLTISGLTVGDSYHYRLVAQNAQGTTYGYDFTLTAGQSAPVNQTPPSISGAAQQGSVLSASPGSWTGIGDTYAYQWQRSTDSGSTWAPITGASGASYTPGAGDLGAEFEVLVTATNAQGSASVTSPPTGAVTSGAPVNTKAPVITGNAVSGQTLSASTGTWTGAGGQTYAYQWSESSGQGYAPISGATSSTYTLQSSDVGHSVEVSAVATNTYGSASATSTPLTVLGYGAPFNTVPPAITGTATRGQTLSVSRGTWQGQPTITYTYQWQRSSGSGYSTVSTGTSYTLAAADVGQTLKVTVTAQNSYGSASASAGLSATVGSGAPQNTAPPKITGIAQQGDKLTVSTGIWSPVASSYTYQWLRSSATGYVAIAKATAASYTLTAADVGQTLEVTVTAKNAYGSAPANAGPTADVSSGAPSNTAPPTITGTAQRGDKLTAHAGTWSPAASSYTYQWLRNAGSGYVAITKATTASYTLQKADEGASIEVAVSAKNAYGVSASTSAATGTVSSVPPVASKLPGIAGAAKRGSVLHETSIGSWTGLGNTYAYQWMDCNAQGQSCEPIAGATKTSYTLTHTDVGQTVAFEVSATNLDASVSATSAPSAVIAALSPAASKNPTIAGTAKVGSTLRETSIGKWTGLGNVYSYQWLDCGATSGSCQPISGKTATTYTVASSDAGDGIALQVTATNPDGRVSATSAPSALVPGGSPGVVRLSASARRPAAQKRTRKRRRASRR